MFNVKLKGHNNKMEDIEYILSPEERRFVDELSSALSVGPPDTSVQDRLLKPHDDVLLYGLGFKHETSSEVLWRTFKSGSALSANLAATYIKFTYVPKLDFSDPDTFRSLSIGSTTYTKLNEFISEMDKI